jgi:hypothetical protein
VRNKDTIPVSWCEESLISEGKVSKGHGDFSRDVRLLSHITQKEREIVRKQRWGRLEGAGSAKPLPHYFRIVMQYAS